MEPAKRNTSRRRRIASAISRFFIATFRILCQCECLSGSQSCCKCVNRVVPLNEQQEKEFSAAGSQGNHSCPPDDNILQASRENWQNPRAPGISGTGYDPAATPIPRPFPAWDPAPMDPSRSGTAIPVGAFPSAEGPGCPECNRDVGSSGLEEQQPQDGLDESVPSPAESPSPGTVPSSSTGQEEGEDVEKMEEEEVGKPGTSQEQGGQEQSVDFSFYSMWEKLWDPLWSSPHSPDVLRYGLENNHPRSEHHVQAPYPSEEAAPASSIPDSELLRVPHTDYEFWAIFNFAGTEAARMLLMERREKAAAQKTSIS
ncbi:uncharacterized protein LOC134353404 [Mobula hypostoma]|uniref:uncharacterized protein LOC134353404 n=1 Tax=Mobula hypostoma TaxID=723540 RepID=UPI002FC3546F